MSQWIEVTKDGERPHRWLNLDQIVTIDGDENGAFLRDVTGQGYLLEGYQVVERNGNPWVRPRLDQIHPVRFQ